MSDPQKHVLKLTATFGSNVVVESVPVGRLYAWTFGPYLANLYHAVSRQVNSLSAGKPAWGELTDLVVTMETNPDEAQVDEGQVPE